MNELEFPKLRWPLDVQHIDHLGEKLLILQDPEGVARQPAVLPAAITVILAECSGQSSVREIASRVERLGIGAGIVGELVRHLHDLGYLESLAVREQLAALHQQFFDADTRPMALADKVYSSDPETLSKTLIEYHQSYAGEGMNHDGAPLQSVIAAICPHIDYRRGWKTYTRISHYLTTFKKPDVLFLPGTAHQPSNGIYHLSRKHFDSPFGVFENAREVTDTMAKHLGSDRAYREEILHRREHSLELQLPFLAYRYRQNGNGHGILPRIVPILVGSLGTSVQQREEPGEIGEVQDFVGALREVLLDLRREGKSCLLFCGIDLTHAGRYFGDRIPMATAEATRRIEFEDRELLSTVLAGDERALFRHIAKDNDARKICGFPSLYTVLRTFRSCRAAVRGECIEYRQAVDPDNDCVVSFAGAAWEDSSGVLRGVSRRAV